MMSPFHNKASVKTHTCHSLLISSWSDQLNSPNIKRNMCAQVCRATPEKAEGSPMPGACNFSKRQVHNITGFCTQ